MDQFDIYVPLLKTFIEEVQEYKGRINMSGVFIPHVLPRYPEAEVKYFYCGQDTYCWVPFDLMIEYYEKNDIEGYINENNKWPEIEDIIRYSSNKEGNFWTLIIRLHIYLHRNELIRVNKMSESDKLLVQELGWGNINAIELPSSLDNEGRWESINQEIYWEIKAKSREFDSIKYILDIYDPDYLFIFNWDMNRVQDIFKGLTPIWNKEEFWDGVISTYNFKNYKAKIIWCIHPNGLRWKSMNINDLIEEISMRL